MATHYFFNSNLSSVMSFDPDTSWAAKSLDSALYLQQKQEKARFQQKQLQEKEQKLLSLYQEEAHKAYQNINTGGGKVRQLFKERRGHQTGWDRSYPLEPLLDNRRGTSLDRSHNDISKPVRRAKSQARKPSREEDATDFETVQNNNEYESGGGALDTLLKLHGRPPVDENESPSRTNDFDPTRLFRKLPNIGTSTLLEDDSDRYKTYVSNKPSTMAPTNLQETKKFPAAHNRVTDVSSLTKNISKLSTSNKKPETKAVNSPAAAGRSKASTPTSASTSRRPTPSPTTSSNAQYTVNNMASSRTAKPNVQGTVSNAGRTAVAPPSTRRVGPPAAASSTARNDLIPCKQCGRQFAPDRIDAHHEICLKTSKKKRKIFDPIKQRLKGTEAEAYLRKGKLPVTPPPPKSNWRRKHEDFIANIRAAKTAQAHVAKGGKLSDLPPPPPMDTSDLIPCPHCGRKFNDAAAARHIPKCATMLHNKPKPGAAARGSVFKKR